MASDITYIENTYPLLVKTIADLTDETSKVIISHELRKLHELEFYSLLKENNFNIQRVINYTVVIIFKIINYFDFEKGVTRRFRRDLSKSRHSCVYNY